MPQHQAHNVRLVRGDDNTFFGAFSREEARKSVCVLSLYFPEGPLDSGFHARAELFQVHKPDITSNHTDS